MNLLERLEIISHYALDEIKNHLLVLENLKRLMLFLIIIFSLLLVTLIDNKVSGEKIKDDGAVITTMLKNDKLLKDYKNQNYIENSNNDLVNSVDNLKEYTNQKADNVNNKNINEIKTEIKTETNNAKEETYKIININKADKSSLMTLNGIGEKMADKIIEYRNTHGEFKTIDEIKKVSGIGDAKFNKIKKYIEV